MSVYQREGSPYWWYTFSIDGERFRGSTRETDERKARLAEAEKFQAERARPSHEQPWRLRELLGTYWTEHARSLDSGGDIFFHFEMMSDFWGRDKPVLEITNSDILDYRAARRGGNIKASDTIKAGKPTAWLRRMVTEQGFIRAVAPQTVNRDLAHLQAAMNWAVDMHRKEMPKITWKRLKAKEAPWRIRFASGDELARLLEAAHIDLRPVILCAVTTGLRRENILSLQWHQVDLKGGAITLPKVKGDKPHMVRITPPLRAALARTEPAHRRGSVFDVTNYKRRWAAAVKNAGLVDFRFHDLRHTFASWARMNGADLADICEALDHSGVAVTQRYAHIQPDRVTTAFERVADLLKTKPVSQKRSQS